MVSSVLFERENINEKRFFNLFFFLCHELFLAREKIMVENHDLTSIRDSIKKILDTVGSRIQSETIYNVDIIAEMFFAMVVLADEWFLNINNNVAEFWSKQTLEEEIFVTSYGGTVVKRKMEKLLGERNFYKPLVYFYMVLLSYGFRGDLTIEARDRLFSLMSKKIQMNTENNILFFQEETFYEEKRGYGKKLFFYNFLLITLLFLIVFYFSIWVFSIAKLEIFLKNLINLK